MIAVVGDLLADVQVRLERFPIEAGTMQKAGWFRVGPGGAGNVAIACARLGLPVACLAELGADEFGGIVRRGLEAEGVVTRHLVVGEGSVTPVAGVMVDPAGRPTYLGFPGSLRLRDLPLEWERVIDQAEAVFADGWVENEGAARVVVKALARGRPRLPTFFDPGPGNPSLANDWQREALAQSQVVLVNETEAERLSGASAGPEVGRAFQLLGAEVVILKRGRRGCAVIRKDGVSDSPGFAVPTVDTTGAGDAVAGAAIYGVLRGINMADLAILLDATGAAKVGKPGTGSSMPSREEIRQVLRAAGHNPDRFLE